MIEGSCLCGGIAYRAERAAGPPAFCHCEMCRKAHGTAFSAILPVARAGFRWTAGEDLLRGYASSPGKLRFFCRRCGSKLASVRADADTVLLRAGCIDRGHEAPAVAHGHVGSKAPWYEIDDDRPRFERGLPGAPPGVDRGSASSAGLSQIRVGTHALRFAAHGSGEPAFLCLHGLADTLAIWDRLAGPLAARGRTVRFDQRGHGGSGAPPGPYAREALAADAIALLDALEIPRAVLVGHSMGGVVAMAAALAQPHRVAGLVLLGTTGRCSEKVSAWYERLARAGETGGLPGLARAIYGRDTTRRLEGDAQGMAHVTRMLRSLHGDPLTDRLGALECPTLLLVGEKDPMGKRASELLRDALPAGRARLEIVPGCGHWLHVETPERVLSAVDAWLPAVSGARPVG